MTPARAALLAGAAVPLLYFGTQLAAAPLYPGYDFTRQVASELGSPLSRAPGVFNTGAILTGVATLGAAFGFARALSRIAAPPGVAWLVVAALVSAGLAGLQAGAFPLPHPRHNPGALGAGLFALPVLLLLAAARTPGAAGLRIYLALNLLLFLLQFPLRGGLLGIDPRDSGGLMQRTFALAVYVPIGVVSWFLLRRTRAEAVDTR